MGNLQGLYLSENHLRSIDPDVFNDVPKLSHLFLDHNNLTELSSSIFHGLPNLIQIHLDTNNLIFIHGNIFEKSSQLELVQIAYNKLSVIDDNIFQELHNLQAVGLAGNLLKTLPRDIFKGLVNIHFLYLGKGNPYTYLDADIFRDVHNLSFCDLSSGKLQTIPVIKHLRKLQVFDVGDNPLRSIDSDTLADVASGVVVVVDQHEVCECYMAKDSSCNAIEDRSPYLTCDRLLSDRVLGIFIWLIGFNALGGNLFVLGLRLLTKSRRQSNATVQHRLLTSLALSDLLMGIYMIVIASADAYFGEGFPMKAESWRSSITCRVSGALSIISSEASVFFVTLISIDRFVNMKFPYSVNRLRSKSVVLVIVCTWLSAFALGIVPSALAGIDDKFYDNSHVCIGLPLALLDKYTSEEREVHVNFGRIEFTRTATVAHNQGQVHGMYFSTAVFLGLNGLCYFIILFCYIGIVKAVKESSKGVRHTQEMKHQMRLTGKVTAIVATDFCCWFPVIILGILVQCRVITLPASVFAWCVTFILPINSAINPYLYTISALVGKLRNKTAATESSGSDVKAKSGGGSKVLTLSSTL